MAFWLCCPYKIAKSRLKIPYVILKQDSIEDICKSITELGRICGSGAIAERMVKNILSEVGSLRAKVKGKARPSVMVCASRELSEPVISTIYIAGQSNFYNELIDIAGGVNVLKERRIAYPQVSLDGISKMNPNIIIDLVGDKSYYHSKDKIDLETIFSIKYLKNQWERSVSADAVKRGRIAVMNGTVYLSPGPRVGEVLRSFAEAIHPEIKR
ncbi:MAG: ABC transporter substrate-binding protein [Synergistaceae bacterium]